MPIGERSLDLFQSGQEVDGDLGSNLRRDQADADQVFDMDLVVSAKGDELHRQERGKIDHPISAIGPDGSVQAGGWDGIVRACPFSRDQQMDALARHWRRLLQQDGDVADRIEEISARSNGVIDARQGSTLDKKIDVLCIPHGSFVHRRNPGGDRVSADHGISNARAIQRSGDETELLLDARDSHEIGLKRGGGLDHTVRIVRCNRTKASRLNGSSRTDRSIGGGGVIGKGRWPGESFPIRRAIKAGNHLLSPDQDYHRPCRLNY